MHLDQLGTVQLHANTLANNLSGKDEIVEDVVVDSGQCTATWALLFVWVGASATWLGQDLTLGAEHNMTAGEFLLQFTHQTGLDLLEGLLFGNWNVDNDSLKEGRERNHLSFHDYHTIFKHSYLLGTEFNFTGTSNVEFTKLLFQIGIHFQLQKSLAD
jgi:hypothetical protein